MSTPTDVDRNWPRAPALAADPRPGTRSLSSTVLGALNVELLGCSATCVDARLTPANGGSASAGELLVLAETVASTAAGASAGETRRAFGAELNAALAARPSPGPVRARATPLHLGESLHRWRVTVEDTGGQLVLDGRCTLAITAA